MLYVDSTASSLEPKEKRDPFPIASSDTATTTSDAVPAVSSSALNSPFAAAHHMGHGPVVHPLTTTTTNAASASPTGETFPNVVNTHGDNTTGTYQPVTPDELPSNRTHHRHGNQTKTYDCNNNISVTNLTEILLTGRPQDFPDCNLVSSPKYNSTATSIPPQNLNNPAYIGGGEAAAPPGFHSSAPSPTPTSTSTDNTTMIRVKVEQINNGTDQTIIVKETLPVPADAGAGGMDMGAGAGSNSTAMADTAPSANTDTASSASTQAAAAPTATGKTPYALPPGFTGP